MANINRTETYEDQLRDPLYRHWVKAGLAPKYLKEGLETFVDNIIKGLQALFLSDICNTLGVVNEKCTACTTANVLPCPTFGICNLRRKGGRCSYHVSNNQKLVHSKCPKNICDRLHEKICLLHRFQPPSWKNTDAQQWCTNHWEIAKCFLSPTGYESQASIQETDCTGVLNIAINCLQVQKYLDVYIDPHNGVLSKIIKTRNDVVHSATMALTEDALDEYISLMINLLEDKKILVNDPNAQNAIVKLKQLKDCTFCISTKDETKIREEAVQAAKQREEEDYLGRKKELQIGLCSMYEKHFKRIPISPLLEWVTEDLDDVFVELFICDDLVHEKQVHERIATNHGIRVKTLNEIFYKTECSQNCKHIYVIGDAGMGKTTWCMKLLNTWVSACNKVRQVSTINSALTDDETMILDFDAVLFVALRHGSRDGNIRDMIKHQLFDEHPNLDILTSEILGKEPDKCLIVIDGLDEWSPPEEFIPHSSLQHSQLPGRKGLNGCSCLTTTRPWKIEKLRLSHEHVDRAVTIKGIEDARCLAERIIQARMEDTSGLNDSITGHRTIEQFEYSISKLSFKPIYIWTELEFLQIPIMLLSVLSMWLDEGKIASTWTGTFTLLIESLVKKAEGDKQSGRRGRLCHIDNLDSIKKQLEIHGHILPECFQQESLVRYGKLFLRLSKMAFETLISPQKENKLVFTESTLAKFFSPIELEVAVKIGFLSQSQIIGKTRTKECSVSFLHKTLQEYFAAVFLCSDIPDHSAALHSFLSYCHDLDHVYSVGNVLLFVFGLNSIIASKISKHIANFELQDTDGLNDYQRISVKCLQEFKNSYDTHNQHLELCALYGASISCSKTREMKLKLFQTNWFVLKNGAESGDSAGDDADTLVDVHNTTKWVPNLISDISKPNPGKTTHSVTVIKLLSGHNMQIKDVNEIDLRLLSELNEIVLCKVSSYIIKLPNHLNKILIVEAFDCSVEIGYISTVELERNMNDDNCTDQLCTDTVTNSVNNPNIYHPKLSLMIIKSELCNLKINEPGDRTEFHFKRVEIERCESCEIEMDHLSSRTTHMNSIVMEIDRITITDSHNIKLRCSDKCKIDMVNYKNCRKCKFECRLNRLTPHRRDSINFYQTNVLLFDRCDNCEFEILILDLVSSSKDDWVKENVEMEKNNLKFNIVEFRNCKLCNFSSNSDVLASYPTLVIKLVAINDYNDEHVFQLYIENVCNFTHVNIKTSAIYVSEQLDRDTFSQILQPITKIKELTLGNCTDKAYEQLTYVLQTLKHVNKITLRHTSYLNLQSQGSASTEYFLYPLPSTNTEHTTIQETIVNVIGQIDKLTHLELIDLSLEAYEAMAYILSSTFRLETLCILNGCELIAESFIDSIKYQIKLRHLKFDHMPEIYQAQLTKNLKSLTKLKTVNINNEALLGESIVSMDRLETLDISTNHNCVLLNVWIYSSNHLSNLKRLTLSGLITEGSEVLANILPSMIRLETLEISSCQHYVLPNVLVSSTNHLSNLKRLTLSGLTTEGSEVLANILPSMIRLETLEISSCQHCVLSHVLVSSTRQLSNLKRLTLNGLTLGGSDILAESIPSMIRLETLEISSCQHYVLQNVKLLVSFTNHFSNLKRLTLNGLTLGGSDILAESIPSMIRLDIGNI